MDSSIAWFKSQKKKNKKKNNIQVENIKNNLVKENREMNEINKKKVIRVAIDAGKGYTKWAYKVLAKSKDKEGNEVEKLTWKTDIEMSTVAKGEAEYGETTYIKNEGEADFAPFNFNIRTKAVENEDKTKNNAEHKALMQRALSKIAKRENIHDFEVIMCISLDQFKLEENVKKMQEEMFVKSFEIKENGDAPTTINIHKLVIEPETLVTTRYAKKTDLKKSNVVLVDIGTLNVGIAPIDRGKLIKEDITAPRIGYDYMINMFKEYTDSKGFDYKKNTLEIYVDDHQRTGHKLDDVFGEFFRNKYSPLIKDEINKKGFGEFSKLVFIGGTSCKCKDLIEESFGDDYLGVEVIKDIYATVRGAYEKGCKDLDKLQS